jgi:hypothetical protein
MYSEMEFIRQPKKPHTEKGFKKKGNNESPRGQVEDAKNVQGQKRIRNEVKKRRERKKKCVTAPSQFSALQS